MPYKRDGLDAHIQDNISKMVHSSFVEMNPLFYFLGLMTPDGRNNLGRPNTSAVFGGATKTKAQVQTTLGTNDRQIRYVKNEPNDGGNISFGGSTTSASDFAEDRFGTAQLRWTHIMEPMKIRKHSLDNAKGDTAVRSIADDSMNPIWERFVKRVNQGLWTDTLTATQQNQVIWQGFMSIQHQLTADNIFGTVDRSVETELNPTAINATTQFPSRAIELDMIRKINVGFNDELGADIKGLVTRSANATGANCWITTPALWYPLSTEAEGRYQVFENGLPDKGLAGFKYPIIKMDNSYVTFDNYCPAGEMYGLNLSTWMIEIQAGHNFNWSGFTPKWRTEEGGGYYEWGNFEVILRVGCDQPWNNVRVSNLQVG